MISPGAGESIQYHLAGSGPTVEQRSAGEVRPAAAYSLEPTQIITGKKNDDGSPELRMDTVARAKPAQDGARGAVDYGKSKAKARDMINKGAGVRLSSADREKKPRRTHQEIA